MPRLTRRFRLNLVLAIAALLIAAFDLFVSAACAADPPPDPDQVAAWTARLQQLVEGHRGEVAVTIKHLPSETTLRYRSDVVMPTASLIKFPVMVEAYRQVEEGMISLDDFLTLEEEDKVPGSGILTSHFSPGVKIRLRDAIRLMIVYSDNTATNLVAEKIGIEAVNRNMAELQMPETRLNSLVYRGSKTSVDRERSRNFGLGSTTSDETVRLYALLHAEKLVSPTASRQMLEHLKRCEDDRKLGRDLPSGVTLAHKSGAVSRARTDGGILFTANGPIAICVLTRKNEDRGWGDNNAAERLIGRVARFALDTFAAEQDRPLDQVVLREGDNGQLVEALQRTLNLRLEPSPQLAVDGDFGANTKRAVTAFEREHKLPSDGVVDEAFWRALGPLAMSEADQPPPEEVNSRTLTRQPSDPLSGPPLVTAKAWCLARRDGTPLAGRHANRPLDMASTTKVMTAVIVLELVGQEPAVLDEQITFSRRADRTIGSTSGLKAGEQTTVAELLYGLMLPSGNDASVALAEHFGPRAAELLTDHSSGVAVDQDDSEATADEDPLDQFILAMNAMADRLELKETRFANPHGLTASNHKASARDLAKLAAYALDNPRFRQIVSTRQRGATVSSISGYKRNVIWKNTNRLLARDGYLGVKTGTTSAAGACLISLAERDGEQRILVVLGCDSSASRYVDSRNLHRYSWIHWPADGEQE